MKIISVVGARPNFMKIAPFTRAIEKHNSEKNNQHIKHIIVHTGQHYDDRMSKKFFEELNIPQADINLGVGSGTHAEQVGNTMIAFEKVLLTENPDWVVVVGDVNATLACSVTAKKQWIKCCHIEAGLRSGDMTMPEEINRIVTDRLCDLLLTPDLLSSNNLIKEGTPDERIRFVGNIMIDTLEANREKVSSLRIADIINRNLLADFNLNTAIPKGENYALMTLHRPSNVDKKELLAPIIDFLINEVSSIITLLWPIHPRTLKKLKEFSLFDVIVKNPNIILLEPLGYLAMLRLNMNARIMLTDSGGLQEECTVLGTPCLTLRWNTERPITLREHGGACVLVGNDVNMMRNEFNKALQQPRISNRPTRWDGRTAERCLNAILEYK
ncbi:UDP-N-acetylglucosamine 2-epimerase [Smithella sp. SC_K08D17]|nr:UDP-N-acetylglucosamine 2-epimerase [Smithella sp. D17]KIE17598.1 UDP-N-acetylglucosamine 2-epimerase [Smithella sp. SC_K08D17]